MIYKSPYGEILEALKLNIENKEFLQTIFINLRYELYKYKKRDLLLDLINLHNDCKDSYISLWSYDIIKHNISNMCLASRIILYMYNKIEFFFCFYIKKSWMQNY